MFDQHFMVAYEYQNGYLKEISGVDHLGNKCISHWKANQYDALGRTKIDTLGDIVTTTYGYDQAQGVLRSINAVITKGTDSGNTVQNLSYNYDAANNLTSRADAVTSVTETFSFDELDRLRFHNRTANGTTDTVEVRYDAIGNITYKSNVGSYQYNSSKVHAVTRVNAPTTSALLNPLAKFTVDWEWNGEKVTQAQPNIHNTDYQYDANGNIQQQGDRRFYWTAFDKPHTMTRKDGNVYRGSVIDYNADFNRSYKQEAIFNSLGVKQQVKETTYYVGKEYEKIVNAQGIKHRYTIATGGGTVQIERDHNTRKDKPKYLLTDNLGSTNVILNGLAQVEQRLEFDPWGMRMAGPQVGTVNSITNKGYTGHEMDDEVGVINMNARIYDPYLGRFLSADSVLPDAGNLQQYNRYAYVINNPLRYTDPTGHSCEGLNSWEACSHKDGHGGTVEEIVVVGERISKWDRYMGSIDDLIPNGYEGTLFKNAEGGGYTLVIHDGELESKDDNDDKVTPDPDIEEVVVTAPRIEQNSLEFYGVGFNDYLELFQEHLFNLEATASGGVAFGAGVNASLSTELDLENPTGRLAYASGAGAFAGATVDGVPLSFGDVNGENMSISFSLGAGPAATFSIIGGPRGFQVKTGFGVGLGAKVNFVDFGVSKPFKDGRFESPKE